MTDKLRQAAEMALEALEKVTDVFRENESNCDQIEHQVWDLAYDAQAPLRQALAQPEQEPVAWLVESHTMSGEVTNYLSWTKSGAGQVPAPTRTPPSPLYTTPPKREWVGLTDVEICAAVGSPIDEVYLVDFRKVIEKVKEKNT